MKDGASTVKYTGYTYKLRSGSPMSKGAQGAGSFYVHTFMAEKTQNDTYLYSEYLPESEDFRGQFGELTSASFNRLNDRSGSVFSGKTTFNSEYVEEDEAITGNVGDF
ncbi:MAG TPA: hypothetical protein VI911_07955 [Patescibacteria group bacterium]|nr:hypothetical protein [Patescibacteria group bacterium]